MSQMSTNQPNANFHRLIRSCYDRTGGDCLSMQTHRQNAHRSMKKTTHTHTRTLSLSSDHSANASARSHMCRIDIYFCTLFKLKADKVRFSIRDLQLDAVQNLCNKHSIHALRVWVRALRLQRKTKMLNWTRYHFTNSPLFFSFGKHTHAPPAIRQHVYARVQNVSHHQRSQRKVSQQ